MPCHVDANRPMLDTITLTFDARFARARAISDSVRCAEKGTPYVARCFRARYACCGARVARRDYPATLRCLYDARAKVRARTRASAPRADNKDAIEDGSDCRALYAMFYDVHVTFTRHHLSLIDVRHHADVDYRYDAAHAARCGAAAALKFFRGCRRRYCCLRSMMHATLPQRA